MLIKFWFKQIFSQWKNLFLLFLTLIFSMSIIALVDSVIKNINNEISSQAKPLLWWDIQIESSKKLSTWQNEYINNLSKKYNFQKQDLIQFYTNFSNWNSSKLVKIIWITKQYPFYGKIDVIKNINNIESWIFLDQETFDNFATDSKIKIWETEFEINGILANDAFASVNIFDWWRTILIPINLLSQTKLTDFGSRISYRILLKVPDNISSKEIATSINNNDLFLNQAQITNSESRLQQLNNTLSAIRIFLVIVIASILILTCVVIVTTIITYFIKNSHMLALLQLMWLTQKKIYIFLLLFLILLILFSWSLSYLFSNFIFVIIRSYELTNSWILYNNSIYIWLIVWLIILLSSSIPLIYNNINLSAISQLKNASTWNVLQWSSITSITIQYLWLCLAWFIIIWDIYIWWAIILSLTLIIYIVINITKYILKIWYKFAKKNNFITFDAIRSTVNLWNKSTLFIWAFLLSFISLIVVSTIGKSISNKLVIDNNNQPWIFVLNITPDKKNLIPQNEQKNIFDTILVRITKINKIDLSEYLQIKNISSEWNEYTREFNATTQIDQNEKIVNWNKLKNWWISLDEKFAKDLWLELWDTVSINLQWRDFDLNVINFRQTNRTNQWPFFYIKLDSKQFENAPKTYFWSKSIKSWESLENIKQDIINLLWPQVSFIEVGKILTIIKDITNKLLVAVNSLIYIIIIFAVMVSIMTIYQSTLLKTNKTILYHLSWATKSRIIKNSIYEYSYIFIIICILSWIIWFWISYGIINSISFVRFDIDTLLWYIYVLGLCLLLSLVIIIFSWFVTKSFANKILRQNIRKKILQ